MSATVEVIVDRDDDIATAKAIRALAARQLGVLAVSIVPGVRSETEVIWAILRALGKRIDQLTNYKVWWIDAERWLTAHGINEIAGPVRPAPRRAHDRRAQGARRQTTGDRARADLRPPAARCRRGTNRSGRLSRQEA